MSVYLRLSGAEMHKKFENDEKAAYSYQVTDSGVLRLLVASSGGNDWRVLNEFSPTSWSEASGQRYTRDVSGLGGFMGGIAEPAKPHTGKAVVS